MRLIFVLFLCTNAASAACLPDEQTFMACQIAENGKSLRVCFDDRTAFYRYGEPDQAPDLALSEPIASLNYEPWSGVGRSIGELVSFENKGYTYDVFAGFERMFGDEEYEDIPHRSFGGVRVSRDHAVAVELACDRQTVDFAWGEGLWSAKTNLGYSWNHRTREWVELPD